MKIAFFDRRPARGNFSVERVFDAVRKNLPKEVEWKVFIPKYISKGLFTRLYDIIEASFHQAEINHITGDVHFLSYLLHKNKTVLTILDCCFLHNEMSKASRAIIKFFWYQLPSKRVAYITTISEFSKNQILSVIKFKSEKIIVIPVPLVEGFKYSPKKFNSTSPNILHIGCAKNKNLLNMLKAVRGLKCRLTIIGHLDAQQLSALKQYRIKFTNLVDLSDVQIIKQYIACDLVSFVSTYEGFGMPIIEANATGRPVITSNFAPMNDVANGSAHLVDPNSVESIREGILKIINDPKYGEELVKLGLKNAKRFAPKLIADQYLKIYKKLTKQQTLK